MSINIRNLNRYARFAWGVLIYNIFVIVWGAFVRATGSGAGCGSHWPTCNGEVFHFPQSVETFIELSHRLTSGVALIGVAIMLVWALRAYPKGHLVRRGAWLSSIFMIIEALVGAGLVLFELTGHNDSPARAYVIAIHLINTFLLLGVITMTAWWASGGRAISLSRLSGRMRWLFGGSFFLTLFLGASGAVTALGDTLFLSSGITPEESALVAQLVGMRVYHPLLAFATGGLLWLTVSQANRSQGQLEREHSQGIATTGKWVLGIYVGQLLLGAVNVYLQAPVWIQLTHLFLADLIWIGLVIFAAQYMAVPATDEVQQASTGSFATLTPQTGD